MELHYISTHKSSHLSRQGFRRRIESRRLRLCWSHPLWNRAETRGHSIWEGPGEIRNGNVCRAARYCDWDVKAERLCALRFFQSGSPGFAKLWAFPKTLPLLHN